MRKIFMFRHQKGGIVTTHAFATKPTPAQLEPLAKECERLHGKEGWGIVHELILLDEGELPDLPKRPPEGERQTISAADVGELKVSGTGTVTPPKK